MDLKGITPSFLPVDPEETLKRGDLEKSLGKSLEVLLIGVSRALMILDTMVGISGQMRVDQILEGLLETGFTVLCLTDRDSWDHLLRILRWTQGLDYLEPLPHSSPNLFCRDQMDPHQVQWDQRGMTSLVKALDPTKIPDKTKDLGDRTLMNVRETEMSCHRDLI